MATTKLLSTLIGLGLAGTAATAELPAPLAAALDGRARIAAEADTESAPDADGEARRARGFDRALPESAKAWGRRAEPRPGEGPRKIGQRLERGAEGREAAKEKGRGEAAEKAVEKGRGEAAEKAAKGRERAEAARARRGR